MSEITFRTAPRFGNGTGLHRVQFLLEQLEIDHHWLARSAIAVTGSNGKGSTAAVCSEIAKEHGLQTGLFTSPHLYRFEERIKIDGVDIDPGELDEASARVAEAAAKYADRHPEDHFGSFELLFASAVRIFSSRGCELCVWEAGIGGRYDPVRLAGAQVAAVVSLDLEHTSLLGSTRELICFDKIDICAPGGTVVFGEGCLPLAERIRTYCALRQLTPVHLGQSAEIDRFTAGPGGASFNLSGPGADILSLHTPLIGRHQATNSAVAVMLFREWAKRTGVPFNGTAAAAGVAHVRWPGRLEIVRESPLTIIDVGHTPDGARAALEALRESYAGKRFVLVTAVSQDKDAARILEILAPHFCAIVCTQAFYKGRDASEIASLAGRFQSPDRITVAPSMVEAPVLATKLAERHGAGIYVAGGMYAAIEFASALRGEDPRALPHL